MEGTDVTNSDKKFVDAVKVVSDMLLEFSRKLQEACGPIGALPMSQEDQANRDYYRNSLAKALDLPRRSDYAWGYLLSQVCRLVDQERASADKHRSSDTSLLTALKTVHEKCRFFWDEGRDGEGWQSAELSEAWSLINAFIDRESCGRTPTGQLFPGEEAAANEELTNLRAENAELANFVIAVGGFWGESKSVLTGETSLAACIQSAFDAAERTERLERTNRRLLSIIKARIEDTNRLRAEIEKYQAVCGAAYQCVGAFGGPLRFLDALSDAANGAPGDAEGLLPVDSPDDSDSARLDRAERALKRAGFTYTEGAQEWRPPIRSSAHVSYLGGQQEVASVLVSNDGLDMELLSHIAFKLPDGFHRLYTIEKEES